MNQLNKYLFLLWVVFFQSTFAIEKEDLKISSDSDLKILSWNIYMLPLLVPMSGRMERAHAIVDTLSKSDYDIIVFQEAFYKKAVREIRTGLEKSFPYMYGPFNPAKNAVSVSSGVWVVSKIPLKVVDVLQFKKGKAADYFANKGAALLEGNFNGKKFQILGTHMQAEDNYTHIRREQFLSIHENLLQKYKEENVPQIICGDMNTEQMIQKEYCYMLKCLDAENAAFDGIQKETYDGTNNLLTESAWKKSKTTFDYILMRSNGAKIRSIKRHVGVFKKKWKKGQNDLSDHYGVVCEVKF